MLDGLEETNVLGSGVQDALEIKVHGETIRILAERLGLTDQFAQFIGEAVAREHRVLARLARSATRINVRAMNLLRLYFHKLLAEAGLAHQLVARGEIHDQIRTAKGESGGRRLGCPEVMTDLDTDTHRPRRKHLVRRGEKTAENRVGHVLMKGTSGDKPPSLVELAHVGEENLGTEAQKLSLGDHEGPIEKPPILHPQRSTDDPKARVPLEPSTIF